MKQKIYYVWRAVSGYGLAVVATQLSLKNWSDSSTATVASSRCPQRFAPSAVLHLSPDLGPHRDRADRDDTESTGLLVIDDADRSPHNQFPFTQNVFHQQLFDFDD